jgi:two-component system, OmpR family, sensor histidine kinase MtrB
VRVLDGVRGAARRAVRLLSRSRAWVRLARMRVRRSLLARVTAATVVLGLFVVALVGQYALQRVTDYLINSRMSAARSASQEGLKEFVDNFRGNNFKDRSFDTFVQEEVGQLSGPADRPTRDVLLLHARNETGKALFPDKHTKNSPIRQEAVPDDLRRTINADPGMQYARLLTVPGPDGPHRAIAVGGIIDFGPAWGGRYELYFFYSLDNEVAILDNFERTFIIGGFAVVALVGGVAWIVTRQVVAPVRQAVRTAEQLASGRLDRRMRVRGEDDLARLARAFNEMAASLERQIHQLEELSRVQRRFVSDVSHELRTPLTTIRMAGEVMYEARGAFDPAVSRSAELLQAQLDRFESLLADLLEVSRFDAGAAQLDLETTDVRECVHRVVDGLRPLAERRDTPLTVRAPTPTMAEFDQRRIERVIRNLVGNAIEHGESRPVLITVAQDAEAVAVCVRDHGVGLRPNEQRLVFNRFWRADPARARTTGGTGLGLAIALEDAHLHGGWLQVWGAPGLGANFRLTLPRRAGAVLSGSPLPLVPPDAPTSARTSAPERTPVAVVVGTGGTHVVGSDGAASVLGSPATGPIALPPLRTSGDDAGLPDDVPPPDVSRRPE